MDMVKDQVSGSLVTHASKFLGESESGVGKALDGIFPALLGKMADTADDSNGLTKLFDMAKGGDDSILDDIGGLFGGGAGNVAKLMNNGSGALNLLLGNSTGGLIDKIAGFSGLKGSAASSLIKMAAPFLMSMVGRHIKNKALDAVGLGKFLGSQRQHARSSMPGGLLSSLGAGFLGKGASAVTGLASDGLDAGKKVVGGAADAAGKVVGGAGKVAGNVVGGAGKVVGGAADLAGDVGGAAVKTGGSILRWLIPLFLLIGIGGWFGIGPGCGGAADMAKDAAAKTVDVAGDAAKGAANVAGDAAKGAADLAGDAVKGAAGAVGAVFGKIDEAAKAALDGIKFTAGSAGSQMMDFIEGGFKGDGRFTFRNLTFATGSANIDGATAVEVDNMAAILKAYPGVTVTVEGYTDNTGNADANVQLSNARANAVKARLIGKGIAANRVMAKGFGAANPVADNGTADGRAQNRRIEMIINK